MKTVEEMKIEIRKLFDKGQVNPCACVSILYQKGFDGRFMEIRKIAETEYKFYTMELSRMKK